MTAKRAKPFIILDLYEQEINCDEKGKDSTNPNVGLEIDLCGFLYEDHTKPNCHLSEKVENISDKPGDAEGDEKCNVGIHHILRFPLLLQIACQTGYKLQINAVRTMNLRAKSTIGRGHTREPRIIPKFINIWVFRAYAVLPFHFFFCSFVTNVRFYHKRSCCFGYNILHKSIWKKFPGLELSERPEAF